MLGREHDEDHVAVRVRGTAASRECASGIEACLVALVEVVSAALPPVSHVRGTTVTATGT